MTHPPIGIPYQPRLRDEIGTYVQCPTCHEKVRLTIRKDEESMSGIEYARHYSAHREIPTRGVVEVRGTPVWEDSALCEDCGATPDDAHAIGCVGDVNGNG